MQSKKDNLDPVDDVRLESWNIAEVFDYIAEDKERCVLVINGYVVDATTYMTAHVRYALDLFGVFNIFK
jgi:cytochrome b involved in lipid metabolism